MPTAQRTPRTRFPLRCPQGEDKRIRDLKCESCALGVQANDQALRGMFFTESALLNRSHPLGPGTSSRTCYVLLPAYPSGSAWPRASRPSPSWTTTTSKPFVASSKCTRTRGVSCRSVTTSERTRFRRTRSRTVRVFDPRLLTPVRVNVCGFVRLGRRGRRAHAATPEGPFCVRFVFSPGEVTS